MVDHGNHCIRIIHHEPAGDTAAAPGAARAERLQAYGVAEDVTVPPGNTLRAVFEDDPYLALATPFAEAEAVVSAEAIPLAMMATLRLPLFVRRRCL